jgi:hypothetical protein
MLDDSALQGDRLVVPLRTRQETVGASGFQIERMDFRLVKSITIQDHRTGRTETEAWFEEV